MPDPLLSLIVGAIGIALGILLVWPRGGILGARERRRARSARILGEDALKHLCTEELEGRAAGLQSLAGALEIGVGPAAALLEALEGRELVVFEEARPKLTAKGREYGLQVIRAHRLWERYLADRTGLSEAEWHREAERREHRFSPEETAALEAQLGHPTHDPHGDPIPTAAGELAPTVGRPLSDAPVDQALRIVHIEDEPEAVYRQIQAEALYLGSGVRILEKTPTRIRFWSDGGEHVLAPSLANNVSVVPVPDTQAKKMLEEMAAHEHLSALALGRRARVLGLSPACRGPERRRLMDLGFVPGTEVKAVLSSPTGDPVAYELRGTLIALRHEQAGLVDVAFVEEEAA